MASDPGGRAHGDGDARRDNAREHDHTAGVHLPRLILALGVTFVVFLAEVVGAWLTGSLAVLADAGHMLTDMLGLTFAAAAAFLARRPATDRRTWGFRRAEVVSAALQALLLLGIGSFVLIEAARRWAEPPQVHGVPMLVVGVIGLLGNIVALAILAGGRGDDLNMRAAFLEVANDALGSVAVIVAAGVLATTGWGRADAVASFIIGALILPRALLLLRESTSILLEETPPGLNLRRLRTHLMEVDHVLDVHDLHATRVASSLPVVTAHVVIEDGCFTDGHVPQLLDALQGCLAGCFDIEHSTLQLESARHVDHEILSHA